MMAPVLTTWHYVRMKNRFVALNVSLVLENQTVV
jgi:hypothetical protein